MTITEYHIELYKRVGGDVDHLLRIGIQEEKTLKNQDIILKIGEIVADLELVKKGLTSFEYTEKLNVKLIELCSNDNVITQMKQLEMFE
ncbi:hypothetical protein [uncultured Aquimarina sp.]|uniref:hypothetical protein n=1 Tax=uncultured Aquimarina sp. TaxID=575652 RepID=UPI0026339D88|nr:hypothetical protein [uncultured Aquimarina sp.]